LKLLHFIVLEIKLEIFVSRTILYLSQFNPLYIWSPGRKSHGVVFYDHTKNDPY
jgi:hypothetical protein